MRGRMLTILLMQCLVVLVCVGATTAVAVAVQERSLRDATRERVLDVATSLAALEQVQQAMGLPVEEAAASLQPLADLVQESAGVDYVVIHDDDGIRITHPTPAERGKRVSTDPTATLAGETSIGSEEGTVGMTLRAKVPIVVDDDVVGGASVGILESRLAADVGDAMWGLLPWVVGSAIVGCLLSGVLTWFIRRRVRRLEDAARELQAQRRVSAALRDQSHEFHTRLHVIRGLIAEGFDDDALDYIGGIVPVTGASAGPDVGGIDDPVVRTVLESAAEPLHARGGMLVLDPASTVESGSFDDDALLVLSNLARNAVEAARDRVEVRVVAAGDGIHLRVDDDGDGIAESDVPRVFERGYSTKTDAEGHGVGLDLVRRTVARRGGTIEVGRADGGGARFTVDLPSARVGDLA